MTERGKEKRKEKRNHFLSPGFAFLLELSVANTLFFGLLRLSIIEYSYNLLIIKNNKAVNMLKTIVKHDRKRKREKERKKKPFPFPGASYFCWYSFITY